MCVYLSFNYKEKFPLPIIPWFFSTLKFSVLYCL